MFGKISKLILPLAWNILLRKNDPFFCTFIVTWRCNARCMMCDVWKKNAEKDFETQQIANVFKKISNIKIIRLTGGEPFLHSGLTDIVHGINKYTTAQIIHITSNGFLTDAMVDFVKAVPGKNIHLKISLNGIGDHYDKIMGVPNAYKKVIKTIEVLRKLQEKYNFVLGINQTITNWQGYIESKEIRSLCAEYQLPYLPVIAYEKAALYDKDVTKHSSNTERVNVTFAPFGNFTKEEIRIILDDFLQSSRKIPNILERLVKYYYLKGLYNRLILYKNTPNPRCVALKNHIRLLPNGDILTCLHNTKTVGNLMKTDFNTIWNGEEVKRMRKWVNQCDGCWAECEVIPNALFSIKTSIDFLNV